MDLSPDEPAASDTLTRPVPGARASGHDDRVWKIPGPGAALPRWTDALAHATGPTVVR